MDTVLNGLRAVGHGLMVCFVVSGCAARPLKPLTASLDSNVRQRAEPNDLGMQLDISFANAPPSALDDALSPVGLRVVVAKNAIGNQLNGHLQAQTRAQLERELSVLLAVPVELIGNSVFIGTVPEDEKYSVIFRIPSLSMDVLKAVLAGLPDISIVTLDETGVAVRGSPAALRRCKESLTVLLTPGGDTVACRVSLARSSGNADISLKPMTADISGVMGRTVLEGTFAFGSKFTSSSTSVYSVARKNVSPQGTVEVTGFTEVPVGFSASVVARDLGNACELRLSISDGDALDGKDPPTRSVNTFDVVAVVPYATDYCIGTFARSGVRAGIKLPMNLTLGGSLQRYNVIVRIEKATRVTQAQSK